MKMLEVRKEEIIEIRRYLHEHPELSFEEESTSKYIEEFYKGKDVKVETNVGGGYGVIVTITRRKTWKNNWITCRFRCYYLKKRMYRSNQKIPVSCMRVVMMDIPLTYWCLLTA